MVNNRFLKLQIIFNINILTIIIRILVDRKMSNEIKYITTIIYKIILTTIL
ncbi:MAG: hypothetical protein QG634_548 [Patescibacteria group bacterium]|nr:hypothetical protein [Patescibacteria group bacterium]